jgi:hypothetical protein
MLTCGKENFTHVEINRVAFGCEETLTCEGKRALRLGWYWQLPGKRLATTKRFLEVPIPATACPVVAHVDHGSIDGWRMDRSK